MFDYSDFAFDVEIQDMPEMASDGLYIPEASECLRCGMCVSGCPTFRLYNVDEETPRSRVRTISKLLNEQTITADEQSHLLNCVQCRACEQICPSRMAYGQLFDQALLKLSLKFNLWAKMAFALIVNKTWRRRLLPLINLYLKSGIQKPLQASGLLTKLGLAQGEALLTLPALTDLAEHYPAQNTKHGTVALFTGCLAEHFDRETQEASIKLLTALGFDVLLPEQQTCCGAIHQHNGLSAQAMIAQNINTFNALNIEAILYSATGCGAMLSEYTDQGFLDKLQDINDFILTHWSDAVNVKPLNSTVAVHEPCSQRNVLKNQQAVYQLLAKVPQLNLISLADNHLCCGAGGSYMLSHPEQAQQLRSLKYVNIKANTADFIVSSNYACAAFLQTSEIKVKHPLVVLAGLI